MGGKTGLFIYSSLLQVVGLFLCSGNKFQPCIGAFEVLLLLNLKGATMGLTHAVAYASDFICFWLFFSYSFVV